VHVTVLNWSKFNPRRDVKRPSWFRLEHTLFSDHKFYDLNAEEIAFWVYCLCCASESNSGTFLLNRNHALKIGRFKAGTIDSAIKKLKDIEAITVDVTPTSRTRNEVVTSTGATDERTDVRTNVTNETDAPTPDKPAVRDTHHFFQVSYKSWEIRQTTIVAWQQAYSKQFVFDELRKAAAWLEANRHKAPKNFERFFTSWLSRGWESERKLLPSNRAAPKGIAEVLREKAEREKK